MTAWTNADQSLVYHWEVNNVPRMFDEPNMPSHDMTLQRVMVSTSPDWPSVSQWYWQLSQSHLEATTPEMVQTVAQLTVLGFPGPGHPYWTEETLRGVAARYPFLDLEPWRQARRVNDRS